MKDEFDKFIEFLKNNQDNGQRLNFESLPEACKLLFEGWKESTKEYEEFLKKYAKQIVLEASRGKYINYDLCITNIDKHIFNEIKNYILTIQELPSIEDKVDVANYSIYLIYFNHFNKKYDCNNLKLRCEMVDSEENWISFYKAESLRDEDLKKKTSVIEKIIK